MSGILITNGNESLNIVGVKVRAALAASIGRSELENAMGRPLKDGDVVQLDIDGQVFQTGVKVLRVHDITVYGVEETTEVAGTDGANLKIINDK